MANAARALKSFAALGDPTRRAIFERVVARPAPVGELARGLPVSRPAVSQHLRVLKQAGLVSETAEGTRRIYRLDPRGIGAMRDWLDEHWAASLAAFKELADAETDREEPEMSTVQELGRGIAPIVQTVEVRASPARAFEIFATRMDRWWAKGRTIGQNEHVAIVIEPRAGGRWFERDAEGTETPWGRVLAWEPPSRLLLAWQINARWAYDPGLTTELELTFAPLDGGGTRVRLEHRDLERFGADAAQHAESLRRGWPGFMTAFAAYADTQP
jgi:DNA-binding transcriptional ArsR family regulator/uncharacterized protein YndB with AHSA1/START domain